MVVGERVINGFWDGQPIWRRRTLAEVLAYELFTNSQSKTRRISISDLSPYTETISLKLV